MYLLYSVAVILLLVISCPWWVLRMLRYGKYRAGLSERLGYAPTRLRATQPTQENCIWIHAVSVGEVLAVSELISALRDVLPSARIVLSTTTAAGQQIARERHGEQSVFYFPIDL